jgi:hypothetical protein
MEHSVLSMDGSTGPRKVVVLTMGTGTVTDSG